MSDDRITATETNSIKRRGGGGTAAILMIAVAAVVIFLFASGFWSVHVTESGALPDVAVTGGALPQVDLNSKEIVVGTKKTNVVLPTVETKNSTIDIPVIGVKDNGEK